MTRRVVWITAGLLLGIPALLVVSFLIWLSLPRKLKVSVKDGQEFCTLSAPVERLPGPVWNLEKRPFTFRSGRDGQGRRVFTMVSEGLDWDLRHDSPVGILWFQIGQSGKARILAVDERPGKEFREERWWKIGSDDTLSLGRFRREDRWHPFHWFDSSLKREEVFVDLDGRTYHPYQSEIGHGPYGSPSGKFLLVIGHTESWPWSRSGDGQTVLEVFRTRDQGRLAGISIERRDVGGLEALRGMRWLSENELMIVTGLESNEILYCRLEK